MDLIRNAKGFLFDLDGVFYQSGKALPGAIDTLDYLRQKNIPFRFLTNTTTKNRKTLQIKLSEIGLKCIEEEIISAGYVGIDFIRKMCSPSCRFFITDNLKKDYSEFEENPEKPEAIVIGDFDDWTFDLLNQAFQHVMNGAEIIAFHKGKYYKVDSGLRLDAGGFVVALEFATGKKAQIVGKPNKAFFQCALDDLNLTPEEVVMFGDDLINDVQGAQNLGISGILVKTGKYHEGMVESSGIDPDDFINSIADLPTILNS
ncbi:MAG: TIGR01458 family HAD-type hydrolase [Candidatus Marinimicrobia bacterium]|jgi:HAD superfamily hydrolase (TIGR01458 family)|nr:TIGR01458 family HAD-type hydrolase [Candidatus Neomarinimicrobiota bacterium]